MLIGWDPERAIERHLRYARCLVDESVSFDHVLAHERPAIAQLVQRNVAGAELWEPDGDCGALVAADTDGNMVGALVAGGAEFTGKITLFVLYVAVEPDWRGRGVGTVLLGTLPQMLGERRGPALTVGSCAQEGARFYQRAGFTVLDPGEPLPFPLGGAWLANRNANHPCWFHRPW